MVRAQPDASFSFTKAGTKVSFTSKQGYYIYQWRFGGGASSTVQNPTYYYDTAYATACLLVKNDYCWAEHCEDIWPMAGIEESLKPNTIQIWPNPGTGIFYIEPGLSSPTQSIIVFNQFGQQIDVVINSSKQGVMVVDLSSFSSGMYYVQMQINGKIYTQKVLLTGI